MLTNVLPAMLGILLMPPAINARLIVSGKLGILPIPRRTPVRNVMKNAFNVLVPQLPARNVRMDTIISEETVSCNALKVLSLLPLPAHACLVANTAKDVLHRSTAKYASLGQ